MSIAIFGAGISGLSLGCSLLKNKFPKKQLSIFESSKEIGGFINTISENNYLVETAATMFTDKNLSVHRLCLFLGLDQDLIVSDGQSLKRYIYYNNKLNLFKPKPLALLFNFSFSMKNKFLIFKNLLEKNKNLTKEDESVQQFFIRNVGADIFVNIIEPMVSGIFAGDCSKLSIAACFPKLKKYEEKYGNLLRGFLLQKKKVKIQTLSLRNGLKQLVDKMGSYLKKNITCEQELKQIFFKQGKVECLFKDKTRKTFDKIILATPSYVSAKILSKMELAKNLLKIEYLPLTICALGYPKSQIPKNLDGLGFLVPNYVSKNVLGGMWNSNIFSGYRSPENKFLTQVFLGGNRNQELVDWDDNKILSLVKKELKTICNINTPFEYSKIIRWKKAIPQYSMEHLDILKKIDNFSKKRPVYFHNNAYNGIGFSDCIENSDKLAQELVENF